jgi:hypothetical protein
MSSSKKSRARPQAHLLAEVRLSVNPRICNMARPRRRVARRYDEARVEAGGVGMGIHTGPLRAAVGDTGVVPSASNTDFSRSGCLWGCLLANASRRAASIATSARRDVTILDGQSAARSSMTLMPASCSPSALPPV